MKTAVSIPDPVFQSAERTARRLKMSRSELYAKAVAAFVEAHRSDDVTRRLDQVYATEPSTLDPVIEAMALSSIERDEW
jgi:metal-responsive CopG/Arc/MetJ family transcriptional regulator